MKIVISVIQNYDADKLLTAVTSEGFGATKISSVGGFLRMGNATVLMAMNNERVPRAREIVSSLCSPRVEVKMDPAVAEMMEFFPAGVHEVPVGGGVVFVLPIERMARIYPDRIDEVATA